MPAWHPHFDVWLVLAGVLASYFFAIAHLGQRFARTEASATRAQKILFTAGILVLWVGADWPIHEFSEKYLYSAHMLQHLLFSMVAPPLILLGTPEWMPRAFFRSDRAMRIARKLTRPLPLIFIFNGFVALTHWPVFIEATLQSEPLHFTAHVMLVVVSVGMWMPVFSPTPDLPRISMPAQMAYLFVQSLLPTIPASFFTFAETPIIEFYANAPRVWGIDVITDQRLAGVMMKTVAGFVLWGFIAVLFFRWHAAEERQSEAERKERRRVQKLTQGGAARQDRGGAVPVDPAESDEAGAEEGPAAVLSCQ